MPLDFPANPTDGQVYPAAPNSEYIYSTSKGAWLSLPTEAAKTVTSDNAPSNPKDGDQWFNTVDGTLYIYVVDVDGGQWVESQAPITANGYYSPNYIINGGFDIWQRGTSLSAGAFTHRADRWIVDQAVTVSRSTDVPAGIEAGYSMLIPAGTGAATSRQAIELPGTSIAGIFSEGKTFTLSFYAKSTASRDLNISATFRNGVVGTNYLTVLNAVPIGTSTSSWSRFSYTFTIPAGSITGANCLPIVITAAAGASADVYITGVQLEAGTIATTFRRNANSLQGELAACQRYYYRAVSGSLYGIFASGKVYSTYNANIYFQLPVPMRVAPTSLEWTGTTGNYQMEVGATGIAITSMAINSFNNTNRIAGIDVGSGPSMTVGSYVGLMANNNTNAYIGLSAEL